MADNTNANKTTKNDWDDEDDDWENWDDAEDNSFQQEEVKSSDDTNKKKIETIVEAPENKKPESPTASNSAWGVGSTWMPFGGVVSSLSTGLGNITSTVSQGLNQVIGVPDPEELARMNAAEAAQLKELQTKKTTQTDEKDSSAQQSLEQKEQPSSSTTTPTFGLGLVSGVTTLGSKVLNTGLDTLEGIGKKTMNILQENDPLLKNKRKMLGLESDKPNLSEVLKEAKKDADQLEDRLKALKIEKSKALLRFEVLFEHYCGLVHLEALEILSKESTLKLQTLLDSVSGNALNELQETINEVKELIELESLEGESDGDYNAKELNDELLAAMVDADLPINFDDMVSKWTQYLDAMSTDANKDVNELFTAGITALSETCALEMNKLHKIAELMLVKQHHSTANEVDCIVQLCKQFYLHINGLTNRYAAALTAKQSDEAKTKISTLFEEMLVAMQQIEKAFNLFVPILQIGAV